MKYIKILVLCLSISIATSCKEYLDIVPDRLITVDDAFSSRLNAERFWYTCYGYLPSAVRFFHDPGMISSMGDELWYYRDPTQYPYTNGDAGDIFGLRIFYGYQNTNEPQLNYWDGGTSAVPLFRGIRDCNTFLENVEEKNIVPDFKDEDERTLWISEVKVLKAYYHFYLMHLYGPIPIMRKNLDLDASPEEVRVFRRPIDEVVDYIVELIDEAMPGLSPSIYDLGTYEFGGRITKPIAKAIKAKALIWAASPLFNGNEAYANFTNKDGTPLVSPTNGTPDLSKWTRAATAVKEAIDAALDGGHDLYKKYDGREHGDMSDSTRLKYTLRYAVTEIFNEEIVWPSTHLADGYCGWGMADNAGSQWQSNLQRECLPPFKDNRYHNGSMGTNLKIAEQFYSDNGIPINEDSEWLDRIGGWARRYETKVAGDDHKYYISSGGTTAQLHFNREPRFYAYIGFDQSIWEGVGRIDEDDYFVISYKTRPEIVSRTNTAKLFNNGTVPTGYFIKKVVHPQTNYYGSSNEYSSRAYSFPLVRLSDLYLLYAEALNEALPGDNDAPPAEVYEYVNKVRTRAGLKGVKESWVKSINPTKPNTKKGMREIIRRERLIELCFEGQRAPDMRRWREAEKEFNTPIQGWNGQLPTEPTNISSFYQVVNHYERRSPFTLKNYLWPIKENNLSINKNLVQNPGW
jgi:hypothetical protein